MKNIFKKNQIIITSLAIMIAVAGYLNYAGTKLDTKDKVKETNAVAEDASVSDISDEDIKVTDNAPDAAQTDMDKLAANTEENKEDSKDTADQAKDLAAEQTSGDIPSMDVDLTNGETAAEDNPGTAVLTGGQANASGGFAAAAKLAREQVRAKNKETFLEIVNNPNLSDEQKQNAINSMISMTDIAEKEAAAEMLLEAKGFTDVVVSITGESVEVIVNTAELTDAKRAQIEDIVKRKTGISAENIIITPMATGN